MPQPRGCELDPASGPSVARAPLSVQILTNGDFKAASMSLSIIMKKIAPVWPWSAMMKSKSASRGSLFCATATSERRFPCELSRSLEQRVRRQGEHYPLESSKKLEPKCDETRVRPPFASTFVQSRLAHDNVRPPGCRGSGGNARLRLATFVGNSCGVWMSQSVEILGERSTEGSRIRGLRAWISG